MSTPNTSIADHKKPDGRIDWDSYNAAQLANGEKCSRCGGIASLIFPPGHQALCPSCKRADSDAGQITHKDFIRCPKCRHQWSVDNEESIYSGGLHSVVCPKCDHEFEVVTMVSFSFESPELLTEQQKASAAR